MTQPLSGNDVYTACIKGEPASKANSRQVVQIQGKVRVIKSKKARDYARNFEIQAVPLDTLIEGDVVFGARIYYKTRRPDLDASLILDLLEGVAYKNDRQVKVKLVFHALSKLSPRCDIVVAPVSMTDEVFRHFTQ